MRYESSALHESFNAGTLNEAISIASHNLETETGGSVEILNVDREGGFAACHAKITTTNEVLRHGQPAKEIVKEERRFVVKPASHY